MKSKRDMFNIVPMGTLNICQIEELVRDKVPDIIKESGKNANFRVLSDDEYKQALKEKMTNEVSALMEAKTVEEITEQLGDIQTLIGHLLHAYNISEDDFIISNIAKDNEKGMFMNRYFLESVSFIDSKE